MEISYIQKHKLKNNIKHKLDKTILNVIGCRFCSWCDKVIKAKPYKWRCVECQAEYKVLRDEELRQDEYEDNISNYEDMRNDLD
tara:strand:- start:703 stop:954 length:252 start_codon:yes stop_codon:yes gene_type:complete